MSFADAAAEMESRIQALERRVSAMEGGLKPDTGTGRTVFVVGMGFGRRITQVGEAYIQKRFAEGALNSTIAHEMGVSPSQIAKRRV